MLTSDRAKLDQRFARESSASCVGNVVLDKKREISTIVWVKSIFALIDIEFQILDVAFKLCDFFLARFQVERETKVELPIGAVKEESLWEVTWRLSLCTLSNVVVILPTSDANKFEGDTCTYQK